MFRSTIDANHGFHATMTAQPGRAEALLQLLLQGAPTDNANCLLYLVGRSASDPDVVHVTEGWTSQQAHAENFTRPASQALVAQIQDLVRGEAQYQDLIPVGGRFPE